MAVYIGMYLAGIIHNLNFAILIVNEMYRRNRSIRELGGSKKLALIQEFLGNTGELVTLTTAIICRTLRSAKVLEYMEFHFHAS
jgi:hypothetical protein